MGLFDLFKKENAQSVFQFIQGNLAPDMKGRDFLAAYKGWVYACVNAIAEDVASTDFHFVREKSTGDTIDDESLVMNLLKNVNPFMSSSELLLYTQSFLELDGNAYWYLPRGSVTKKPSEIWVLDPSRMTIVKSKTDFIGGYLWKDDTGKQVPLGVEEVLHFKRFNPLNRYRGMGTVQAAALAIDIDTYAAQWNKNFFFNAAIPSAVLSTDKAITPEQYERIKSKWESQHTGTANSNKLTILQGGMTYTPINLSQREMQFLESRRFTRDEIMGIFRVPKTVLGLTDDVNRANAEASEYVFAKRVIKPRVKFICDRLNEFLLPMFNEDKARFIYDDVVPRNAELELTEREASVNKWVTVNEIRNEDGLDPIANGDSLYVSSLLVPLGQTPDAVQQGKQAKLKHFDPDRLKAMDTRVRYVQSQINKRTTTISKFYLQLGEEIIGVSKGFDTKGVKDDLMRLFFNKTEEVMVSFKNEGENIAKEVVPHAAETLLARIGSDVSFDLQNPRAQEFIRNSGLDLVRSVEGTVKEQIKERVVAGIDSGLGADAIAGNIKEFFDNGSKYMANRIARTEVIAAYSEGNLEAGLEDPLIVEKRWLSLPDADEDCTQNVDDGDIPKDAGFSSGDFAPPVHPNCRCDVEYLVEENSRTQPSGFFDNLQAGQIDFNAPVGGGSETVRTLDEATTFAKNSDITDTVYHGGPASQIADFKANGMKVDPNGIYGKAVYFSTDKTVADHYGAETITAKIDVKNIKLFDGQIEMYREARALGYNSGKEYMDYLSNNYDAVIDTTSKFIGVFKPQSIMIFEQ